MKEKKRALFSFTKMNKYYLIPFITPIISFICNLLGTLIANEDTDKKPNFLFFPISDSIGDTIAGSIYFIQLYKNKHNSAKEKKIKKNKRKIFCLIIVMTFIICPMYICFYIDDDIYLLLPFSLSLIIAILFSIFLLKVNIYSHQILSIIISLIGFIFLLISNVKIPFNKFYIYIILSLLNPSYISILKYSSTIYFISPFLCSFLYGMISLIIFIIGTIICALYKLKGFSFIEITDSFGGKMFIPYYLLTLITNSIVTALTLLEVYYFSPILYFLSESINPMLFYFLKLEKGQSFYIYIFIIIGFLFEIISILLYNEIIIINACDLNINTVKYIKKREKEDIISALYDNDDEDNGENKNKRKNNNVEISQYIFNLDESSTL